MATGNAEARAPSWPASHSGRERKWPPDARNADRSSQRTAGNRAPTAALPTALSASKLQRIWSAFGIAKNNPLAVFGHGWHGGADSGSDVVSVGVSVDSRHPVADTI